MLDGTGVSGSDMVLIEDRSYVKLIGFEIRNDLGVTTARACASSAAGSHIEIRDNDIHDIRGSDAMGITVYGTGATPISNLIIDGNEISRLRAVPQRGADAERQRHRLRR